MNCAECGKPLDYVPTIYAKPPYLCPNLGEEGSKCYAKWLWRVVYRNGKVK